MLYALGGRVVDLGNLSVDSIQAQSHGAGIRYPRLVGALQCVMTVVLVEVATVVAVEQGRCVIA